MKTLKDIIAELKASMFLVGAQTIDQLRNADYVITGKTREWLAR